MTYSSAPFATMLMLGLAAGPAVASQGLQPGMRTMIQQGGIEGAILGPWAPYPNGADPDYGYVYDDPRYGRVVFADPNDRRRRHLRRWDEGQRAVRVRLRSRRSM